MNCPNCGNPNRPNATFCQSCGQRFNTLPTPAPSSSPAPYAYSPDDADVSQVGATGQSSSIWGPFAGYGTRRDHMAWLLEGLGDQAVELRKTITQRFENRQIPDARIKRMTLTGKGLAIEKRPFYRIQRGLATVWLYVARFGQDLYISQVSYVKGQISLLRIIVLVLLLALVGLYSLNALLTYISSQAIQVNLDLMGGTGVRGLDTFVMLLGVMVCCTGPLGMLASLALTFAIVFSLYKFLTEKDILALLRSPLNEFQVDDIVSLEKAVNETVRQSADLIGIDRKLLSPDAARQFNRRVI
ncbi:MAG: zinc ribbon domain-containing protein [Anaerolineae bacterium]|nr:zinc ribbon domain-containing protein [Anaerolineae bacterium]